VAQSARAWVARRVAMLLLLVTAAGLAAGGVARLAGAGQAADAVWLGVAVCGMAYACWIAAAAIARGRLSVDVIALLALAGAIAVDELLTGEIWAHESAEEKDLYPALNRLLGGTDPAATMSRAHAEIAYQIARLGRLIADIGDRVPDETDVADLRGVLYGLYAILRLHTAQEDEAYLSLDDDAETIGGGRP
jgi:hemerythrin HHE cation binding domain-containing protein